MPEGAAPATTAEHRRPRRSRWTWVVTVLAVLALLSPLAWWLGRPAPDAGLSLAQALAAPSATPSTGPAVPPGSAGVPPSPDGPSPAPSSPTSSAEASPYGDVVARDASLEALEPGPADPAPARLLVDSLGVDAAVDAVGVEDDGSMVVPAAIDRVGWYRFGSAPGAERGHTVLAGHVDAAGEGPGALFDLRGVEVGTVVTVVDEEGGTHGYEVVSRETITKDVLPVDDIFARDGEHRLVVVTCGGPFIPELSSYRDNVVVTAVPVARS